MNRASKVLNRLNENDFIEQKFEIKMVDSCSDGLINYYFETGILIECDENKLKHIVSGIVEESGLELVAFGIDGPGFIIKVDDPKLKEKINKLGKVLEGKLKSRITERDILDEIKS